MSFDADALSVALAKHGPVARVVVAGVKGSVPREVGASMLVWAEGQSGTIGGGALEWEAARLARAHLNGDGGPGLRHLSLGPSLGQCCGGAVTLLTEVFVQAPQHKAGIYARAQGLLPRPHLLGGWFVEPVTEPARDLWIWGAGHVGRALVDVLAPLPGITITWVDVETARFPTHVPTGVTVLPAAKPEALVPHAPLRAEHLILTYSHALDLALCHGLLSHGFARCGLIGSATKWARFRSRLRTLGHAPDRIARIQCPIGDPGLGKHPQAIAIGVAAAFLTTAARDTRQKATQ